MRCKGDQPRFVDASTNHFVRKVGESDLAEDGVIVIPDGMAVETEEYNEAPNSGPSLHTVHTPGVRIRMLSFGDACYCSRWEVME